jgi:hypothetical protein
MNTFISTLSKLNLKLKNKDYPKSIHINGDEWPIKFVNNVSDEDGHFGETDPGDEVVRIKKSLGRKETLITFIHEILHVFEFSYEYEMSHDTIYALEKPLLDLIVNNSPLSELKLAA